MQTIQYSIPESIHFYFEKIVSCIFAAIARCGGGVFSYSGILDLGGQTLIFDIFETPLEVKDLRVAGNLLGSYPVTRIVNRHAHSDHRFGNQVFKKSTIIFSETVWQNMQTQHESAVQDKDDPTEIRGILQDHQKQFAIEANPKVKQTLKDLIARFSCYLESIGNLQPRLPNQTFSQKVIFRGSEREAELSLAGTAHISGDNYLVLPTEKFPFIGDYGYYPIVICEGDCIPDECVKMLRKIIASDLEIFIQGHGSVGAKQEIKLLDRFTNLLRNGLCHPGRWRKVLRASCK